ncbi:MAG: hypothetical protein NZ707_02075 [Rhodospirillales bacterium]|nr:hypothetical protein [Rhodospirillales bacterium]
MRIGRTKNPDTRYPHGGSNMMRRAVITYKETAPSKDRCHVAET